MLKRKICGWLIFMLMLCGTVYGQKNNTNSAYATRLDTLVFKGGKWINNTDSLPVLISRFRKLNSQYHDHASAVYADFYNAQYLSLKSDDIKSMQFALLSLNEAQKWKINQALPGIYTVIGTLHKENTNYPMAFIAAEKGLEAAVQNKDTVDIIQMLGIKAMFKRGYSLHFHKNIEKDSSLIIRMLALKLAEANPKYEALRVPFYDNIAQHYLILKKYDTAEYYAKKGIDLALKHDMKRSLTYSYGWIGDAYYYGGDKKNGISYLNKALQLAIDIRQPYRKMEICNDMAQCYASTNDYKEAYHYQSQYERLLDSLQVRGNEKQIGELQIKYETVKKDEALALLNLADTQKNKQLYWLLISAIVFLALILILMYMYSIIRHKNDTLVANNIKINDQSGKLQTLMQELHHRVKNNLQIVSSLLTLQSNRLTDEKARNALDVSRQRIEAMSIIHNSLYQHDSADKVNMKEFLPVLLGNILDSFGKKRDEVNMEIEIAINNIDVDIAMPLGLIINEWITNIFKHAYQNINLRPEIKINAYYDHGSIMLKINDNGVGMPMDLWENPKNSFGVKLIKILIKQIGGICHISNTNGTMMELDIPYSKNM